MNNNMTIILYGAGRAAENELNAVKESGGNPVCFVDTDVDKQGNYHLGLPVISLVDAKEKYGEFNVHVTIAFPARLEVFEYLIQQGISKQRILNYVEYYRGCHQIESALLVSDIALWFCSKNRNGSRISERVSWEDTIADSVSKWVKLRDELIEDVKSGKVNPCMNCQEVKDSFFAANKKIKTLSYGIPSKCQLACIYCRQTKRVRPQEDMDGALRTFDFSVFMKHLEDNKLIAEDAGIYVGTGEITISPHKNQVWEAAEKYKLYVSTNALVFDSKLAKLAARPGSGINISVDSGTHETYKRIKGADAYHKVWRNIKEYVSNGANVNLKYIFIPENSNDADVEGFAKEAFEAGVASIICSADFFRTSPLSEQQLNSLIKMFKLAEDYGIPIDLDHMEFSLIEELEFSRAAEYICLKPKTT
jgi:pyruvate-formate lyase-activating enzyme